MKSNKKLHLLNPIVYNNKNKIFDIKFNPIYDTLALVDLEGKLKLLKVEDKVTTIKNFKVCKESIYSLDFSLDGESILSGTSEGELVIINGSKVQMRKKAHEKSINTVKFIKEKLFVSSDETGLIKIFDLRTKKEIFSFKEQEEEITDFEFHQNLLCASCIDGTLGVYDIRKEGKYKLHALSDCIEDELYCMKLVKGGQKVACGTSEGPIALFNWDWFGDYKDRILGHPGSVNTLERYSDNILISGCEDGGIRFISVNPKYIHSMITDITEIKNNKGFNDINKISLDKDKKLLAASSNINYVKFYDISNLDIEVDQNHIEEEDSIKADDNNEEDNEVNNEVNNEDNNEVNKDNSDSSFEDNSDMSVEDKENNDNENGVQKEDEASNNSEDDKEENNNDADDNDSKSFSDSDSDDSRKKSKKTDKTLKLTKQSNSDLLIQKERRKDFFNDI